MDGALPQVSGGRPSRAAATAGAAAMTAQIHAENAPLGKMPFLNGYVEQQLMSLPPTVALPTTPIKPDKPARKPRAKKGTKRKMG